MHKYNKIWVYCEVFSLPPPPCKIGTAILAGSPRNSGEILPTGVFIPGPGRIPVRFSPESEIPGSQNLAGIQPWIPSRSSPRSKNPRSQSLARILSRISPKNKFPAAQILARSCLESCCVSHWKGNSCRNSLREFRQKFGHAATNLF